MGCGASTSDSTAVRRTNSTGGEANSEIRSAVSSPSKTRRREAPDDESLSARRGISQDVEKQSQSDSPVQSLGTSNEGRQPEEIDSLGEGQVLTAVPKPATSTGEDTTQTGNQNSRQSKSPEAALNSANQLNACGGVLPRRTERVLRYSSPTARDQRRNSESNGSASTQSEVVEMDIGWAYSSNSTARLSVSSGSSTDAVVLPTTRCSEPRLPFFSVSILAPHIPHDTLEIRRRLIGGYTDISRGIAYLTPTQRWEALLQETSVVEDMQKRPLTPPPYLSGAGMLWVGVRDEKCLPTLLPPPAPRPAPDSTPTSLKSKRRRFEEHLFHKLLNGAIGAIHTFEEEILDDGEIANYTVQQCAVRVRELYSWCNETISVNPNHLRMKTILGQLQISLRDTAILLEDPKRYLEAFARIDPQGLVFQAEVLSLQDERRKVKEVQKDCTVPEAQVGPPNPLQKSFLDVPSNDDDHEVNEHVRLSVKKARDVVSMMILLSTTADSSSNSTSATSDSDGLNPSSLASSQSQLQLQLLAALRFLRRSAFQKLRYITIMLRNAMEIEKFFFFRVVGSDLS